MKELLVICTTESPFRDPDGNMYIQLDGMSMGSPLGPTFANFFMAEVENRTLDGMSPNSKPSLYVRYIDDIFVICDEETLLQMKDTMSQISGMNFTIEESIGSRF